MKHLKISLLAAGMLCLGNIQAQQSSVGANLVNSNQYQEAPVSHQHVHNHGSTSIGTSTVQAQGTFANQASSGNGHCKTFELNQAHYQSRGLLNQFNTESLEAAQNVSPVGIDKTPGVNTISVIFHVVHNPNNPAENVSNANIMDVFNDLSEDFQLLNADAGNVRPGFGFTPADANINFCLATQDPSGTPLVELGVVRVSATEDWYNSDAGEGIK